jgi:hypothetical protein
MSDCQLINADKIKQALRDFYPKISSYPFLEIGAYSGGSLRHWIDVIKENGGSNQLFVVDPYDGEESQLGRDPGSLMEEMLANLGTYENGMHFKMKSRQFFNEINRDCRSPREVTVFGFVLVDGAHTEDAMRADVEDSLACMTRPAMLVVDDVSWAEGFDIWIEKLIGDGGEIEWLAAHDSSIPGGGSNRHQAIIRLKGYDER